MHRGNSIPIIRQTLSADGSIWQSIVGATKPGSQKKQFPFEIPTIKTEIALDSGTMRVIYFLGGSIATGLILSAVLKRANAKK